jgi:hypothetical protein
MNILGVAECYAQLLTGVELDSQKAACREVGKGSNPVNSIAIKKLARIGFSGSGWQSISSNHIAVVHARGRCL